MTSLQRALRGGLASLATASMFAGSIRAQETTPPAATGASRQVTAHFTINYSDIDSAQVARLAARLETERARIVEDLGGSAAPMVTIEMYASPSALSRSRSSTVQHAGMPGFTVGQDRIHVLSPNALGWSAPEDMVSYLSHEFTHCVIAGRNPHVSNNPRWLWESVAMYEASYRKDPKKVAYMTALQPPVFADLNSLLDSRLFDDGYTIGEFIVDRWGKPGLLKLIDANGQVDQALGVSQAQFEQDWFAWVRRTYTF